MIAGHKTFWIVIELVLLIISGIFIETIYIENISPDKNVPVLFHQTQCKIAHKRLEVVGKFWQRYRADFYVSFMANGSLYQSNTSANGLDRNFFLDKQSQVNALNQFNLDERYLCWYDPENPSRVVLLLRHNFASSFPILIFMCIAIIMLYYLFLNLVRFGRKKKVKRMEKRQKRK